MKFKTAVFTAVFVCLSAMSAMADMIEVKGKGFISGTIISDKDNEIVFRDNYGQVSNFPRSQVTYIEKEKKSAGGFKKLSLTSGKDFLSGLSKGAASIKGAKNFDQWIDENSNLADQITRSLNQISQTALDLLYRGQDMSELTKTAQAKVTGLKDYQSKDLVTGGIGMGIMFLGGLAFVVFGFRLIADAFEKHFLWGVAFLAIPLSYVAPIVGGSVGLFAMIPYFMSLCFVVKHWRIARAAFVAQIFSGNILLLGFFILQLAS